MSQCNQLGDSISSLINKLDEKTSIHFSNHELQEDIKLNTSLGAYQDCMLPCACNVSCPITSKVGHNMMPFRCCH